MPEPWKIKAVESIRLLDKEARSKKLKQAGYNLFKLAAEDVFIDLLTDSGTSAMSDRQWGAMMVGDESYAGSRSFFSLEKAVWEIFGFTYVIPIHQGRVGENLLFSTLLKPGDIVPSNTHFDTTRANIEANKGIAVDFLIPEGKNPSIWHPFKGNMDVEKLRGCLSQNPGKVPLVMLTLTNNSGGGQPVSLANVKSVKRVCDEHRVPLVIDACRFAENAWFIREREDAYKNQSIPEIVREIFAQADGCIMSAKKDGLANIGGFIGLKHETWVEQLRNKLILIEGFPTYGGLAGRDLEAVAQGLREVVDERYLSARVGQVRRFGEKLTNSGVPCVIPIGGHAVYLDARAFLSHLPPSLYPGQALVIALYLEGGIRACEIGGVMFGKKNLETGEEMLPDLDLVRLAVPRRVYTNDHLDYVASVILEIWKNREKIQGVKIAKRPAMLPHFTASFELEENPLLKRIP